MANQRSELRVWYHRNFASFSAKLEAMRQGKGVDWKAIKAEHVAAGLVREGTAISTIRNLWLAVRKQRERETVKRPRAAPRVVEHHRPSPEPAKAPSGREEAGSGDGGGIAGLLKRERFD